MGVYFLCSLILVIGMYSHTQRSNFIYPLLLVSALILPAAFWLTGVPILHATFPVLFLAIVAWTFSSLTVTVSEDSLRWRFGPGILRWSRSLADIESVTQDKSTWLQGWGIRLTGFGILYNVSGTDFIKVRLKNGKVFGLGTDDPADLLSAIDQKIHKRT